MMGIEFQGFDELEKKLAEAEKKLPGARDKFLMQEGELLRGKAAELSPVDTGRLRMGWKRSGVHGGRIEVYDNVSYAAHQEYGHRVKVHGKFTGRFIPGRHMLRDALGEQQKSFQEDAHDILEGMFS